jgi:glycosyltransferase involved in cell wall biosynthesis
MEFNNTISGKTFLIVVNVDWFLVSHRLPIASALLKSGCIVHIATTFTSKKSLLMNMGFIVHDVSFDRKKLGLFKFLGVFLRLVALLKQIRPDIVHLITMQPILIGGVALFLSQGSKCVISISGLGHVFIADSLFSRLRRLFILKWYKLVLNFRPHPAVIFQNKSDLRCITQVSDSVKNQSYLIPGSGVDLSRFASPPLTSVKEPLVLMASRLLHSKGVNEFVDAANTLYSNGYKARFQLVGEPDYSNPGAIKQSVIDSWKHNSIVELLGYRDDIDLLMKNCFIFVLPSYYPEGLPKVLCEASAAGRPIVTTDHPGCRDAIVNGETGILVPPKDSKSLADAIAFLLDNHDYAISLGNAGRRYASNYFDIRHVVSSHLSIYSNLLIS